MQTRVNQRGEGRLGCVFGVLFLALACFLAYKLIPVKIQANEMRDVIQDESRAASGRSTAEVKKAIFTRAQELKVPLDESNLVVTRRADYIRVECEYSVEIQFPGYTHHKTYKFDAENPVF
jgi:hypothetical protein